MRKIYAVMYSGPFVGTDTMDLVVAESEDDAVCQCYPTAVEWYESFQETYEGEEEEWAEPEVDIWAEEYDPEVHDGQYPGGPPSDEYIEELKKQLVK